jgi:hypothetical protein
MDKQSKDITRVIVAQLNGLVYFLLGFFFMLAGGILGLYFLVLKVPQKNFNFTMLEITLTLSFVVIGLWFIIVGGKVYSKARDSEIKLVGEAIE